MLVVVIETYVEISPVGEEWTERLIEERHKFHSEKAARKYIQRQLDWADQAPVLDYDVEMKIWGNAKPDNS
jgi:hypothetical protein